MHHGFICIDCSVTDFPNTGIPSKCGTQLPGKKRRLCRVSGCKSTTHRVCGNQPCLKPTCGKHSIILCYSCLFLTSKLRDKICLNCVDDLHS